MLVVQHSILLVDDNEAILFALKEYFIAHGYQVECARELEEAQALLSDTRCSVVIADLCLGGIHGVEGLEMVSYVRERCPSTRIIILTAYGSLAIEAEARRRGVDVFLYKPKPLSEVGQIVGELLGGESERPPCPK
jgi:ActR/RegA family two-component response regulator